jgi:hypothetical protein
MAAQILDFSDWGRGGYQKSMLTYFIEIFGSSRTQTSGFIAIFGNLDTRLPP